MKFTLAMLGAIIAAFIVGAFTPETSWLITVYDLIGTLFINALKMIVIPLVMTAIIAHHKFSSVNLLFLC